MNEELLLLIISSPSGAGKTTLTRDLLQHFPQFGFSVSHTTRIARASETDGVDYHFVDRTVFQELINRKAFAEWAEVHGNLYGTSLEEIERCKREGKRGILFDIDYQGARQIKATIPDAVAIFVLPPSLDALRKRLKGRGDMNSETIEYRIHNALREIEHYRYFNYLVVNDDLEEACIRMRSIAYAELSRRDRMSPKAEELLRQARSAF